MLDALPDLAKVSTIRHTDSVVSMDDKPSQALRGGRQSLDAPCHRRRA